MKSDNLEKITFENRAWDKADYPRLHMKEPEKFKFTEIQNFEPITKEIHLSIGYHHGQSKRYGTNRWYLETLIYNRTRCNGKTEIFSSIEEIKEHIKTKYNKLPIFPELNMVKNNEL